jgi:hypothetical protein
MVARHTYNALLKGVRERNRRKTRRINNPGKYVSEKADPADLLQRHVPHLAFFDEAYYDRVVAKLKAQNGPCRRSDDPAEDPFLRRPKKKTRCPGGVTFCGVCGRAFVWGGHGQTDRLMCSGAREHRCWNGATFDGPEAAQRIAATALDEVERLPDFDPVFLRMVEDEARRLDGDREKRIADRRRELLDIEREIANVVRFIRAADKDEASPALAEELRRLEGRRVVVKAELTCD